MASKKNTKPRYVLLADELRQAVLRGDFADEGSFPTESVLCEKHGVSRFTVREALRLLTEEGLITRLRGSGTKVQPASARAGALHQPLSNVGEILQYAKDTRISFEPRGMSEIDPDIAEHIGVAVSGEWFAFRGIRRKQGRRRPIALTDVWLHPDLADAVARFDDASPTLFAQIEVYSGRKVKRITQDIQAIAASEEVAEILGIEPSGPVLRILRAYFDKRNELYEISVNYHPGERFAYSMHIEADG